MIRNLVAGLLFAGLFFGVSAGTSTAARADVAADVGTALAANPEGGDVLSDAIASMIANSLDPVTTAQQILAALGSATPDQKKAVGKGLGEATALLGVSAPDKAAEITALLDTADPYVKTAFNDALNTPTGGIIGMSGNAPTNIIGTTGGSYSGGQASPN